MLTGDNKGLRRRIIPHYTVHAVRLGTIRADKSGTVFGTPPGTIVDIPIWAAAIEGNGQTLLVDTGLKDAAKWSRDDPHFIEPDQIIDRALAGHACAAVYEHLESLAWFGAAAYS